MNTSITKLLFRLALPVLATNSANALTTYVKDTTPITESEYSEFVDRYGAVSVGESKLEWIDPQLAIHKGFLDDTGKCRFDEYYDVPTSALEQGRIVFVAEELAVDNLTCERVIQHGLIDLALQVNAQLL